MPFVRFRFSCVPFHVDIPNILFAVAILNLSYGEPLTYTSINLIAWGEYPVNEVIYGLCSVAT